MKERPILFSAPMVRAILEGRKTQTRRVINPQPTGRGSSDGKSETTLHYELLYGAIKCPFGQIGDQIWVRENYRTDRQVDSAKPSELSKGEPILYEADSVFRTYGCHPLEWGKQRPSIFMPRWASRIQLEITGVRVERLQEISEEDAQAEGCDIAFDNEMSIGYFQSFQSLWTDINGAESWQSNPFVWVVEFRKL